jgi:hypothetical protein
MKHHILRTWPIYYDRIASGEKRFEVRKNDRDFKEGDMVTLRCLKDNHLRSRLDRRKKMTFRIGYIFHGSFCDLGLSDGYCVFQLLPYSPKPKVTKFMRAWQQSFQDQQSEQPDTPIYDFVFNKQRAFEAALKAVGIIT